VTETFARAAEAFATLVDRIPDTAWTGPGLGAWDLRSLVGHTSRSLTTVQTYLERPAEVEEIATPEDYYARVAGFLATTAPAAVLERVVQAGFALGDDPGRAVRALLADVLPKVRGAGDPVIETIVGGMRLSCYLPTRTFELAVHGLDIARATSLPFELPVEVLAEVATLAARSAVAQGKGPELVMALTGRAELPSGFSMV
jgi:uncharacterized protein (TIGR03083 family)